MSSFCNEKLAGDTEARQDGPQPASRCGRNNQNFPYPTEFVTREHIGGFYESLRPSLTAFLRRRSLTIEQTEDVVQETFLRLLCRTPKDLQADNVRFWVFRVAQNLATDLHRSALRFDWNPHELLEAAASITHCSSFNPEEQYLNAERWRSVERNMVKLTARQRDAISLRINGVSSVQIAVQLKTTPHSVEELIRRGLNRLERTSECGPVSQVRSK